ncbi:fluoride export protein 1-like [Prosopis cineraria]|uniref:fluoride export protein 1-like n=1 Tax=Prosopis cineraria TaxID=364024 RepID=UPI0024107E5D|nr:fluoride export protein 1-like [Prosopis cineraria]
MEQTGSGSSSQRRYSLSMSSRRSHQTQEDDETGSDSVSEAGDIGDRALPSRRYGASNSFRLSFDRRSENGISASITDNLKSQPHPAFLHSNAPVTPLPPDTSSPIPTAAILAPEDSKQESDKGLPELLDYASCLVHLAVFGILGVLTRYLLQKLFGPGVGGVTSDQTILYLDLPSNMVGSFLMGWFGVVFKGDISRVSEHLAIAISTGYLGSLTTFSGWNQKMLELSVSGHWLFAALGFFIGLFLVAFSIIFGIETAKGFRWLLNRSSVCKRCEMKWKVSTCKRQLGVMAVLVVVLGLLWGVFGALVKAKFKHGGSAAQLWFGCMVGPVGVWIRWFLARLNGRGLGSSGLMKWIPFGTLIANVSAAGVMAALATVKEAVNTRNCDTVVAGIQFGLMGCLSTVSTFAAEFNAMRESKHPWRAYAYAAITICVSFSLGILIYSVPVWTRGFDVDT